MDKIIEQTRMLGEAIRDSAAYRAMQTADEALREDPEVRALQEKMNAKILELAAVSPEAQRDPDAIAKIAAAVEEDKKAIAALPASVRAAEARADFLQLMNRVNQVLEFTVTGELSATGTCSGNCGSCGGCASK